MAYYYGGPLKDTAYVKFTKRGIRGISKKKPSLRAGEYAFKIELAVPEIFFKDKDFLLAKIVLDEKDILQPNLKVTTVAHGDKTMKNIVIE